ncbi:MAG: DUF5597 domain-containing protein, partial [Bacteroidota bacterium]|nr:DUF5597 domain-containing protein [Bacteroidota bacterium]
GNYKLQVNLRYNNRSKENPEMGYGIIIGINFDEYVIAGSDIEVTFTTSNPQLPTVGLASVFEGTFENGNWVPGRRLNGDEIMKDYDFAGQALQNKTGTVARLVGPNPGIIKVRLYKY